MEVTFRNYSWSSEKFKSYTKLIRKELLEHKFEVDKVKNEYCVYDSYKSEDWNWMEKVY